MPPFIVTLVSQMFLSGLAVWFTSTVSTSVSIGNLPLAFTVIGRGGVAGVPYAFLLCAAVALGAYWVLRFTLLGKWLYAVGTNPQAARVSGVPVSRVVWLAFILSSFCASIAAIIYTGRLETGTPILGQRVFLDVIGAVVIGGVSLFGGKGKISWVIFGVLFLSVVDKGLQLLGVSLFAVFAVKGGVILVAAVLDALRNRLLVGSAR
jgi:ribose/xylose/arabinose/galactoside ABC-type transport system permease subunit